MTEYGEVLGYLTITVMYQEAGSSNQIVEEQLLEVGKFFDEDELAYRAKDMVRSILMEVE